MDREIKGFVFGLLEKNINYKDIVSSFLWLWRGIKIFFIDEVWDAVIEVIFLSFILIILTFSCFLEDE